MAPSQYNVPALEPTAVQLDPITGLTTLLAIVQTPPEQVSAPITKPAVVHGVAKIGVIQIEPLQYIPLEIVFTPLHAPPAIAVPVVGAPPTHVVPLQ